MFVVELFLPLDRSDGSDVSPAEIESLISQLTERFGGATAFTRAPAKGLWKDAGSTEEDRIVIIEVMVDQLEERWWSDYRAMLEKQFQQDEILLRATSCRKL